MHNNRSIFAIFPFLWLSVQFWSKFSISRYLCFFRLFYLLHEMSKCLLPLSSLYFQFHHKNLINHNRSENPTTNQRWTKETRKYQMLKCCRKMIKWNVWESHDIVDTWLTENYCPDKSWYFILTCDNSCLLLQMITTKHCYSMLASPQ